jgi:hypothetical protein
MESKALAMSSLRKKGLVFFGMQTFDDALDKDEVVMDASLFDEGTLT